MRVESGASYSAIATAMGVCKSTVSRYLAKWRARVPVERIGKVGRPKKVTEQVRKQIRSLVSANKHISSRGISAALAVGSPRRGSLDVTPRTIRRSLNEMNYRNSTPVRVPKLTSKHKQQRIEWCKKHLRFDWKKMIFSDETMIELDRCKIRQWHPKGKRPAKQSPKFTRKLMFWSAICGTRSGPLVKILGTLKSEGYIELIQSHLLPWMEKNELQEHIFQQDNATCHVSRMTRSFFESKNIRLVGWPPNSPDLNPIENLWGILKTEVEKRSPKTIDELEAVALEEWRKISPSTILKTVKTMTKRINQVLKRNGEKCDY